MRSMQQMSWGTTCCPKWPERVSAWLSPRETKVDPISPTVGALNTVRPGLRCCLENKLVRVQSSHVRCTARLWPTIRQTNTPVEKLKSGWVASSRLPGKIIYFGFEWIGNVRKLVEATYF